MSSEVKPPSGRPRKRRKKPATRRDLLCHTEHDPKGAEDLVRSVDKLRLGEATDRHSTAALNTAEFFAERKAKANRGAFRRILDREGGKPPRSGDELP
jgi:hypothetical protein